MRTSKTMIATAVCLAVVGGAAVVYAQNADNKYDGTSSPSQSQTASPQADQSGSAGGTAVPAQQKSGTGLDGASKGTNAPSGLNGSSSGSSMDNSPSSSTSPSSERPARADRN